MWNVRLSFANEMYHFYTNVLMLHGGEAGGLQRPQDQLTSLLFYDRTSVTPHS